jgi:hypothetical protein
MQYTFEGHPEFKVEGRKNEVLIVYHDKDEYLDALYIHFNDEFESIPSDLKLPVLGGTMWVSQCKDIITKVFPKVDVSKFTGSSWHGQYVEINKSDIPRLIPIRKINQNR